MTEQEIARECEQRFQNGGPRVYVWNPTKGSLTPSPHPNKWAVIHADAGEQVFTRRKIAGLYGWRVTHKV